MQHLTPAYTSCVVPIRAHHPLAVFTDRRSNESVLHKAVLEAFSQQRIGTEKVLQHLIIAYRTIAAKYGKHICTILS